MKLNAQHIRAKKKLLNPKADGAKKLLLAAFMVDDRPPLCCGACEKIKRRWGKFERGVLGYAFMGSRGYENSDVEEESSSRRIQDGMKWISGRKWEGASRRTFGRLDVTA